MRRAILALLLIAPAAAPALAQTASERANRQLQRDSARDRLSEAARDLETNGRQETPALVDDMDRYRGAIAPERRETSSNNPTDVLTGSVPSMGGNIQR